MFVSTSTSHLILVLTFVDALLQVTVRGSFDAGGIAVVADETVSVVVDAKVVVACLKSTVVTVELDVAFPDLVTLVVYVVVAL